MIKLKENHLEWALKHLLKYSHSDFYPRLFEFAAISHNWQAVKEYILSLDMSKYEPKSPMIQLAPKPNGTFRVAHQLDPIDSLIYTTLIREICDTIEEYRVPESENIACSYRIKPDTEGSFFGKDTGWDIFTSRTDDLIKKFQNGYVLVADITDFYNQIYTHRINALISEASKGAYDEQAAVIENFLLAMNRKTSRGIPVGPAPSIILAELIMTSIDKFILDNYGKDFVRYVDDIRIFFHTFEDAITILHKLTFFLYSYHRLVCSSEKTKILDVNTFETQYIVDERKVENAAVIDQADSLTSEKMEELIANLPPYTDYFDYDEAYEETLQQILNEEHISLLSNAYHTLVERALTPPIDYVLLRHVLRQAARYRIRSIIPLVLDNFFMILPVIRESVIYLNAVINKKVVQQNHARFEQIFSNFYMTFPFINLWVSYLLQDDSFNEINLPANYTRIISTRDQALIALRKNDTTWVRGYREQIDLLGSWDRRATLYSASLLPASEMLPLVNSIAASGDIIDKSLASFMSSKKKT
jgi:hypothetical protein